jgi:DNA (cytosine-5)-methyltransferase 1
MSAKRGSPNVRLVRGPFLRLPTHQDHCETTQELLDLCARLRRGDPQAILAADLFAGAGGMSLGLEQAGMRVVLSADHDPEALETHKHHFGGLSVDWDLGDPDNVERIAELMQAASIDVLAGGPPCQPFSKAGRSGMRYLVRSGNRDPHDRRRDLWRSYLEVVRLCMPRAVIMENVPDMALDREMFILRSMVLELERLGYSVQERVIETWRYGVPQFRQRLIMVAVREGAGFVWPAEVPKKVTVANAISDLPAIEGGWRPKGGAAGWAEYATPRTEYQRSMRENVPDEDAHKVFDHITRPVRPDDLAAFELIDSQTRYSELPEELKRYRDDIFDDKYKRLEADDVSRTITAHIAKDGYWYIHPEQNRTITVREAARLQTFPDDFRFAGSPSAAFRQIGNAVPPRLGLAVGKAVLEALDSEGEAPASSETISLTLASWFREDRRSPLPWFKANSRWHVLVGEILLERATPVVAESVWPLLEKRRSPLAVLEHAEEFLEIASWLGRGDEANQVLDLARAISNPEDEELSDEKLGELVSKGYIRRTSADLAMMVSSENEEPVVVTAGALRVAARVHKNLIRRRNQHTDGRIAIARLVGYGPDSRAAHLGLIELGSTLCTPTKAECSACPLAHICRSAFQV